MSGRVYQWRRARRDYAARLRQVSTLIEELRQRQRGLDPARYGARR